MFSKRPMFLAFLFWFALPYQRFIGSTNKRNNFMTSKRTNIFLIFLFVFFYLPRDFFLLGLDDEKSFLCKSKINSKQNFWHWGEGNLNIFSDIFIWAFFLSTSSGVVGLVPSKWRNEPIKTTRHSHLMKLSPFLLNKLLLFRNMSLKLMG